MSNSAVVGFAVQSVYDVLSVIGAISVAVAVLATGGVHECVTV